MIVPPCHAAPRCVGRILDARQQGSSADHPPPGGGTRRSSRPGPARCSAPCRRQCAHVHGGVRHVAYASSCAPLRARSSCKSRSARMKSAGQVQRVGESAAPAQNVRPGPWQTPVQACLPLWPDRDLHAGRFAHDGGPGLPIRGAGVASSGRCRGSRPPHRRRQRQFQRFGQRPSARRVFGAANIAATETPSCRWCRVHTGAVALLRQSEGIRAGPSCPSIGTTSVCAESMMPAPVTVRCSAKVRPFRTLSSVMRDHAGHREPTLEP